MPDKKTTKPQQQEVKISVKGDMTGNIVVGNENTIGHPATLSNSPLRSAIMGIAGVAVIAILLIAWKVLSSTTNGAEEPYSPGILESNPVLPTATSIPTGVWKIEVFDNIRLDGSPVFTFTQPAEANAEGGYQINITPQDFRQQVSELPASNYSLRLAGTFVFQEGYFEFHCEHHDGCRVFVDGRSWIDTWWDGGGGHDLARDLPAGKHVVVIEFYDKSGYGLLEVRSRVKP